MVAIKESFQNIYTTEYKKEETAEYNKEETTESNKVKTTEYIEEYMTKYINTISILIPMEIETNKIEYDSINDLVNIINETKYETKEEEIKYYDSILDNIEKIFNNNYNISK